VTRSPTAAVPVNPRGFFIVLKYECASIARMKSRPHPIHLLVLGAVVLRGLGEFVSLQRWRLREWRVR
jgi:hypothetical protein